MRWQHPLLLAGLLQKTLLLPLALWFAAARLVTDFATLLVPGTLATLGHFAGGSAAGDRCCLFLKSLAEASYYRCRRQSRHGAGNPSACRWRCCRRACCWAIHRCCCAAGNADPARCCWCCAACRSWCGRCCSCARSRVGSMAALLALGLAYGGMLGKGLRRNSRIATAGAAAGVAPRRLAAASPRWSTACCRMRCQAGELHRLPLGMRDPRLGGDGAGRRRRPAS